MKELALVLALVFGSGCAIVMELANNNDPNMQGPTYITPCRMKPKHLLRIVCFWGDGRLHCGPGIGPKWYKEWL